MASNGEPKTKSWMHYPVQAGAGNRCRLLVGGRTLVYDLDGFLEIEREPAATPTLALRALRLSGNLVDGKACGAPQKIWLYPMGGAGSAPKELSERNGVLTANLMISLAIESRDPALATPIEPTSHGFAALPYALVHLHVDLSLGVDTPVLLLRATGPGESPVTSEAVAADVLLCCGPSFFDAPQCLELCLDIKIAVETDAQGNETPMCESKQVKELVAAANQLLGCDPPGQCCIKLRIGGISTVSVPQIPLDVDAKKIGDVTAVTKIARVDPKSRCYNVYIVRTVKNTAGGVTAWGAAGIDGSLVDQSSTDTPKTGANVLVHELGHALGLARNTGDKTEPNGVDRHSSDPKNVMSGVGGAPGDKLNPLQCARMRSSPHLVSTGAPCEIHAKGGIWF